MRKGEDEYEKFVEDLGYNPREYLEFERQELRIDRSYISEIAETCCWVAIFLTMAYVLFF